MDPQTLSQTTVLYALSTIAQVCAALVAFIGALGLYRLQSLRAEREQRLQDLRMLLIRCGQSADYVPFFSGELVLTLAHRYKDDPASVPVRDALNSILQLIEKLQPITLRMRRRLFWFCVLQTLLIFQAIYSFLFVDSLSRHPSEFKMFLVVAVAVIIFSTIRMTIDITSLPAAEPRRGILNRVREWRRRRTVPGTAVRGDPAVKSQKFHLALLTIIPRRTPAPRSLPLGAGGQKNAPLTYPTLQPAARSPSA